MYRIGIASTDGIVVNQHFGRADKFYIVDIDENWDSSLVEIRELIPVCEGGFHSDERLLQTIRKLSDLEFLLVSNVGASAERMLRQRGIQVFEIPGIIKESLDKMLGYIKIQWVLEYL